MSAPAQNTRASVAAPVADPRFTKWKLAGESLGLEESALLDFIRSEMKEEREAEERRMEAEERRMEAEERRMKEEREANEREREREYEARRVREEREYELEMRRCEIESQRITAEVDVNASTSRVQSSVSSGDHLKLKMPYFEDKDDLESYLRQFERVAKLQDWRESDWATRLGTLLKGKARETYVRLSDEEAADYDTLKTALLHRFCLTGEEYRRKLRVAKRGNDESYKEFAIRQRLYFERWRELPGKSETYDDVKDLLLQEQFLRCAPHELSTFVKDRQPKNMDDVVKHAQVFAESRGTMGRTPPTLRPGGNELKSENRREENKRETPNYRVNNGPNRNINDRGDIRRSANSRGDRKCFTCGLPGHIARDCGKRPELREKPPGAITTVVGAALHEPMETRNLCEGCADIIFDPVCTVRVEGKVTTGIRDTGATVTVVDSSLVPKSCYKEGTKKITMASSQHHEELPLADVFMDTPYFSAKTEVVVMSEAVHPILIGNQRRDGNGDSIPVPVYPVREVCAPVQTRLQEAADRKGAPKLHTSEPTISDIKPDDIKREQGEDASLGKYRRAMEENKTLGKGKHAASIISKKGIMYRVYRDKDNEYHQLLVPKKFRGEVLRIAHDAPMAGHMGVARTKERLWQEFYWPGVLGDIRRYCASCFTCQRTAPRGNVRKCPLGKAPIIETPFQRVAVDIIGPIVPASQRGNRYVLTVIDYATRYVEAVPVKSIKTEVIAEELWKLWTRLGFPEEIQTDRGTQFTSETMKEVNRLLSIKGITTSPYHAQANGLVERFNGTVKSMLRKLCAEQPREWDRYLPALLFAYREVPQESLRFSPFELLYGRKVRGPIQILKQAWTDEEIQTEARDVAEYVADLKGRLEQTCTLARQHLEKAAARHERNFNKKTVRRDFEIGSQVFILLPEKHNKLEVAWRGPFEVVEKISDCNYKIKVGHKAKVYHMNMLKQYVPREQSTDDQAEENVAVIVEEEEDTEPFLPINHLPLLPIQKKEGPGNVHFGPRLEPEQKKRGQQLCQKYERILTDLPLKTNLEECELKLDSKSPVFVRQYPLPHSKINTVKEEVDTMRKLGVIEPTVSAYSAPIVLVKKKDDSVRFCVDYRHLNKELSFDAEPIPDVDQLFSELGKAKFFTKVDLSKGYWQIPVKEEDRPKTAFTTPQGQFQWVTMPFGLKTAGAVFSRMMRKLLNPLGRNDIHSFMDDILIATETWEQHLEALEAVFQRLEEANLSAKPSKCYLGFEEVSFLGHRVGEGKLGPEDDKVQKILTAQRPRTKKDVRSFLGLANFYRRYIANFSNIACPLTDLTKAGKPEKVIWTDKCERAFEKLKTELGKQPVVLLPDKDKPYVLRTDASDTGMGAVLLQNQGEGLQPVAYASKKFVGAETNYSTVEKECLASVWGVKKFEPYLYGTHFVLQTDHQPLDYLRKKKTTNGRLMRWALQLQQYSFQVEVIPGKDNVGADYMSRASHMDD